MISCARLLGCFVKNPEPIPLSYGKGNPIDVNCSAVGYKKLPFLSLIHQCVPNGVGYLIGI